jgi:hypothetical protein
MYHSSMFCYDGFVYYGESMDVKGCILTRFSHDCFFLTRQVFFERTMREVYPFLEPRRGVIIIRDVE